MFIYILIALIYLAVGSTIERRRYSIENFNFKQIAGTKQWYQDEYKKAERERKAINHKSYCYTTISKSYACQNCTEYNSSKYRELTQRMADAKAEILAIPDPNVRETVVIGWPIYLIGQWIKNAEPPMTEEVARVKEIENAKHAAELEEFKVREMEALDRQLELSKP